MVFVVYCNFDSFAVGRNLHVAGVGLMRVISGHLVASGDARLHDTVLVKITVLVVEVDLVENTGFVALALHMELVEGQRALHGVSVLIEDIRPVFLADYSSLQLIVSARRTALTRRGNPFRADGEFDLVGELVGDRAAVFELLGHRCARLTLLRIFHGIGQQGNNAAVILFYSYVFNAVVMVAVAGVVILVEVGESDRKVISIAVDDLRVFAAGDDRGVIQIIQGVLFKITPKSQARRFGILPAGLRLSRVLPIYRAGKVHLAGQHHFELAVGICLVELAAVDTGVRRLDSVVIVLIDAFFVADGDL